MTVWSRNERVSGKRIDSLIGKARAVNSPTVPLKGGKTIGKVGEREPYMKVGSEKDWMLWLDGDGDISVKNLDDVVGLREEAEVDIHDGRLWITQGKHKSWFYILPPEDGQQEFVQPQSVKTVFNVDPSLIAEMVKKAKYVRIEAGINKTGARTVLVTYYDGDMNFINGMDLKTGWEGEPVTTLFHAKDVSKWNRLGDEAKAKIFDDYDTVFPGIELEGYDHGIDYDYVLPNNAQIIPAGTNYRNGGYVSDEERDWALSCNRKRGKARFGRR